MQIKALGCSDHLHFVRSVNIGCQTNHWKGISQNQAYWESVVVGLCTCIACCKQSTPCGWRSSKSCFSKQSTPCGWRSSKSCFSLLGVGV